MSSKKRKKNLITMLSLLFVMVALIGSYIGYTIYEKNQKEKKAASEEAAENEAKETFPIHEASEESLNEISIVKGDTTLTFIKNDNVWKLKGEEDFPLDTDSVDNIAGTIAALNATSKVTEQADNLEEYGLSQPSLLVTSQDNQGNQFTFKVGDQLVVDSSYYGSINDEATVYVIPSEVESIFDVTKQMLFCKGEIPALTEDQLLEMQLSTKSNGNLHIVYDEENPYDYTGIYKWYSIADNRYPVNVDNTRISTILDSIAACTLDQGVAYGENAMKEYGLTEPEGMLYLRYKDIENPSAEKEFVLHIGKSDENGNYYVSVNNDTNVYYLPGQQGIDIMTNRDEDMMSVYLHLVNIGDLSHLKITTPSGMSEYELSSEAATDADGKESTAVTYTKNGTKIEESEFKDFYQKLIGLQHSGVLTYDDKVSSEPVMTVQFDLTNDKEITACYYDYSESEYAVEINGKLQFTADKSTIDSFMESLN